MDGRLIILQAILVVGIFSWLPISYSRCDFPALFNFGDSSSDTGAVHFTFPYNTLAENSPYGETYFGESKYRYSDGRLSVDFFAEALGFPFLSPYLQSVGSNFGHGANFAASGATVRIVPFIAPISLTVQINQFKIFKQQVLASVNAHGPLNYLPSPEAFTTGIYTLEIGGNDFSYGYMNLKLGPDQIKQTILPRVARSIAGAVQALYEQGARTILVRDVGPQGCQPFWLSYFPHSSDDLDEYGCFSSYNDAVRFYNDLLRSQLSILRNRLKNATIVYVNTYDIVHDFIANPSKYGTRFQFYDHGVLRSRRQIQLRLCSAVRIQWNHQWPRRGGHFVLQSIVVCQLGRCPLDGSGQQASDQADSGRKFLRACVPPRRSLRSPVSGLTSAYNVEFLAANKAS